MTDSPSPSTLLDVLNAAPAGNTALLIPETGARVSYESLRRQVVQAADIFAGAGIQKGDRVAMALPNGPARRCFSLCLRTPCGRVIFRRCPLR